MFFYNFPVFSQQCPDVFQCFPMFPHVLQAISWMPIPGKIAPKPQAAPMLHAAEEQRRKEVPFEPLPKCRGRSSQVPGTVIEEFASENGH